MISSQTRAAAFLRGFFAFLASKQVRYAVLHGGEDGFEHELSDVDFAVDRLSFLNLPELINAYCTQANWQLCQVLRHETTAAYFVCSASDDPTCAVALDACSDYQRNGMLFLSAEDLLKNLKSLSWGGYGLTPNTELRYRFAKAAAKNKDYLTATNEFTRYPEEPRHDCAKWLKEKWAIPTVSWSPMDLSSALSKLRASSNQSPSLLQAGAIKRILSRILCPTGLVVIVGQTDFEATAARLESVFGHLYFRRTRKAARWQPAMLKNLIASTLIVIPELSFLWSKLIPQDCLYRLDIGASDKSQCMAIARHLQQRYVKRDFF